MEVSREGQYRRVNESSRQLAYGAMVYVRKGIVMEAGLFLAKAVTIAVRYSCVRRQFGSAKGAAGGAPGETKVMDYKTQQHRALPLLATAYAFVFVGQWMNELYTDLMARIRRGDLSTLSEVHAASAGLKSLTTSVTAVCPLWTPSLDLQGRGSSSPWEARAREEAVSVGSKDKRVVVSFSPALALAECHRGVPQAVRRPWVPVRVGPPPAVCHLRASLHIRGRQLGAPAPGTPPACLAHPLDLRLRQSLPLDLESADGDKGRSGGTAQESGVGALVSVSAAGGQVPAQGYLPGIPGASAQWNSPIRRGCRAPSERQVPCPIRCAWQGACSNTAGLIHQPTSPAAKKLFGCAYMQLTL